MIIWSVFLFYVALTGPAESKTTETVVNELMQNVRGEISSSQSDGDVKELTQNMRGSIPLQKARDTDDLHIVFSTDCDAFQDWQSILLFHSATQVKQAGFITRIASGCDDKKKSELTELYKKLFPSYRVHFTPDFKTDTKTEESYDFYNKPFGVLHWMDNAFPPVPSGTVVAIVDPDFIFLRPFTAIMEHQANTLVSGDVKIGDVFHKVKRGHAVGQHYGLGAPWVNDYHAKFNRTKICGADSPCRRVPSEAEGYKFYSVGPPLILEKNDLHRLTKTWTQFVPRVYERYPYLLAEMYGYSLAAAHEKLPHLRVDHLMVSDTSGDGEGFPWVDALVDDVCEPPVEGIFYPDHPLPTFLHYCQGYRAGELGFWKREVDADIFSCGADMLIEPPRDLGTRDHAINHKKVLLIFDIYVVVNLWPRRRLTLSIDNYPS
jgi:peptidyl serine alpha-galactosyltransferase